MAVLVIRWRRPSPLRRWVGFRINFFEAGSAFTYVTACMLAELLNSPFRRELQPVGYPRGCLDCYRVQ